MINAIMSTDIQVTSKGTDEQLIKCPDKVDSSPFLWHWEAPTSSIIPWISSFGSGSGSSCSWWQPLLHHLLQVYQLRAKNSPCCHHQSVQLVGILGHDACAPAHHSKGEDTPACLQICTDLFNEFM